VKVALLLISVLLTSCENGNNNNTKVPMQIDCISLKPNRPYVGGSICREVIGEIESCHRGWGRSGWVVPCTIYREAESIRKQLELQ